MQFNADSKCLFILLFSILAFTMVDAQKFRYSLPGLDTLETFIVSGSSSSVLRNGQAEIISNNTLTSFQLAFHQSGENSPVLDRFRQTQFTSDLFAFYGISRSGRLDVGVQAKYLRNRIDNAAASSMFRVFKGGNSEDGQGSVLDPNAFFDRSFGGLAFIGLRFRALPFQSIPELVINGGYSFSTVNDETEQLRLAADRDFADIGLTYYKKLNNSTYYFFSANGQAFFSSPITDENRYVTSASFFLIQRTTNQKFTFYPGITYSLTFKPSKLDSNPSLISESTFLLAYGGIQYAPQPEYNIFLIAGIPLITDVTNPQQEIIRSSFSTISLGFRVGIN